MLIVKNLICFYLVLNLTKTYEIGNSSLITLKPPVSAKKHCTEEGRVVNSEDTTCSTYYFCLLKNKSFVQKKFSCSLGTLFDSNLRVCSASYKCSSTVMPTTLNNTILSNVLTNSTFCISDKNYTENFTCFQKGRFVNPRDPTCTTYFLCSLLRNGSFIQTKYSCPVGSLFDPELQLCSLLYQCPCFTTLSPTFSTTTIKLPTTSTSTICFADQNITENFTCNEKGRFFNVKDLSCTTYFLCSLLRNGSFIQTKYSCPIGSFFDPELHLCSELYNCPCSTTSELVTSSTTTTDSTKYSNFTTTSSSSAICLTGINKEVNFTCSEKGRFVNLKDPSCTTYFLCSLLRNGSFIQTKYPCPKGSFFDPELHLCSELYHCPCSTTSDLHISSTTTKSTTSSIITDSTKYSNSTTSSAVCLADIYKKENFTCSEKGRFANPKDPSCTTYFLCSLLRNGSLIQTKYSCPDGAFFDPELHLCNVLYQCPCSETTTEMASTTPRIDPCIPPETTDFTCSAKGRFPNKLDISCTSYYLCNLLRNGTFVQTKYYCPSGSHFDPHIHICNTVYKCPCNF
ncbi:uncharacterized protein LOC123005043 [Tribolium madens]|uniref:uncharacterized protein LOC123005043 n=1 Tax=Tribolium madens TaxID=41895 RepID=UPI001CF73946|nr:uncharacterized protein LOC123005043 [Tribolium madens]